MQAQCLYQPGEFPLNGKDSRKEYVRTSIEYLRSNLDFLAADGVQHHPPFRRTDGPFHVVNLGLPADVLEKILHTNAKRMLGLAATG